MVREAISVESRIEQVTVYASGARVRRVATVVAPVPAALRFVGLPLALIEDSVRVSVDGAAVVTAIRVGDDVAATAAAEETLELRAARRRVTLGESEVERLDTALQQLAAAPIVAEDPSDDAPASWTAVVAARRALVQVRGERELSLRERMAVARRELDEARRAFEVASERDRRSGSAREAKLHEPRRHVELETNASGGDITIALEYQVAAARWAPSYVARLDQDHARFELRAIVAQDSGEEWVGIALRLSTAEPERFAELPELAAQKIGRRQHEPVRRGFRAPPTGAEALYLDYEREFPRPTFETSFAKAEFDDSMYEGRAPTAPPAPPMMSMGQRELAPKDQVWDEESSNAMPAKAKPMSVPAAARRSRGGGIAGTIDGTRPALGSTVMPAAEQPSTHRYSTPPGGSPRRSELLEVVPMPRLDYGNLVMAPARADEHGRLVPTSRQISGDVLARIEAGIAVIQQLALPPGHDDEWEHVYDYAFATDGKVDVRSDGAWHSIALTSRAGTAKLRHVAVPREQADVFRVATLANPFEGPLLPGPIDVYDRGQFLVTSEVDYTPPGGTVEVGLGVDAQVKVARNVEFHEETTGMLRGGLKLVHAITIEIENLAARPIDLEIRERVPVTRDGEDDIEVAIGKIEPAWEKWSPDASAPRDERLRGGYRWRVDVPASHKKLLRASYEVKIAGKHELVGGNRREP